VCAMQEMKELAALAYRDSTVENREFWKNEMGQALREIQQVYDDKMDLMRGEVETYYNLKVRMFIISLSCRYRPFSMTHVDVVFDLQGH